MAANNSSLDLRQTYQTGLTEILQLLNMQDRNKLLMDRDFTDKIIGYLSYFHSLIDHIQSPDLRYACLKDIAKYLQLQRLTKGDIFLSQGQTFSRFYLLLEGELLCFDHKQPDVLNQEFIHQKSIIAAEEFLQQQKDRLSTQLEGYKELEAQNELIQISLKHLQSLQTPAEQLELLKYHRHLFRLSGKICLFKAIENASCRIKPFNTLGCFFEAQQTSQYLLIASKDTTIAYLDEEIYKRIFATLREQFHFVGKALERIFLFSSSFNKKMIRDMGMIFRERVVKGVIYTTGDPAKEIFVVKKGIITLTKNQVKIAEIQVGKIFGHEDVKEYFNLNGGNRNQNAAACSGCANGKSCSNSECLNNNNGLSSCKNKTTNNLGNVTPRILSAATKGGSICTLLCADITMLRQNIRKELVYSLFQAGAMKLKQYDQKYFKLGQSKKQQLSLEDTLLKIKKVEGEKRFSLQGEILDSQMITSPSSSQLLFSRILQRGEHNNFVREKQLKKNDSSEKYNVSRCQSQSLANLNEGTREEVRGFCVDQNQKSNKDGYLFDGSVTRKQEVSKQILGSILHQEKVQELTDSLDSSIAARLSASGTDTYPTTQEFTEGNKTKERIRQSSPLSIKTRMTRAGVAKMISNVNSTMNQRRSSSFSQITQQQSNSKLIYNSTINSANNLHCGSNSSMNSSVDARYIEQRLSWEVVGTPLSAQTEIVQKRFRNSFGEKSLNFSSIQKNLMVSNINKNKRPTTKAQNSTLQIIPDITSDSGFLVAAAAGSPSPPTTTELLDEEQFPIQLVSRYSFSGYTNSNTGHGVNLSNQDDPLLTSSPHENSRKKEFFKRPNLHITLGEESHINKDSYLSPPKVLSGSPCREQNSKKGSPSTSSKFKRKIQSVFSRNPQPPSCSSENLRDSSQPTATDPSRYVQKIKNETSIQLNKKSRTDFEGPKTRKRYQLQQQLFRNSLLTHHLEELSETKETSAPLLRIISSTHSTQIRGSSSSSTRNPPQIAQKTHGSKPSSEYQNSATYLNKQQIFQYYEEWKSHLNQNQNKKTAQSNFEETL